MPFLTEKDALLPQNDKTPEIIGPRPSSSKNFYDAEADIADNEGEDEDDFDPKRHLVNDIMAMVFGLALLLSVVFIFLPDSFWGDKPGPMTIEQRVHRILSDTPLIGMSFTCSSRSTLTLQ